MEEMEAQTQISGKVRIVPRGEYNGATRYTKLDIVKYNGQSYMALAETTGNLPTNTEYWQLLVEKPVKGTDYWTASEQAEMVQDLITDITPTLNQKADKSEIPDVSNFITKDVNDLTYYTKTTNMNDSLNLKQNITDNTLQTTNKTIPTAINEVNSIAKGANQALSYNNYSAMITEFNTLSSDVYRVGQNIMIITLEVPDLWIESIESTSSTYTYTTDEAFINSLETNGYVQVGYYRLSLLETQKVDLTNYAEIDDVPTELADLTDDSTHRLVTDTEKQTWNSKGTYSKPNDGIPKTDLASAVQASLGKADTALQSEDIADFITKDVNNLTNYELKTNTGSLINLSINNQTYVMTLQLKNSDGTVISTGSIDLPLETVVVGGRYDNTTKKVILTLENGNTIDFSVADLVSGLQTEITSTNKLASDLVDDTNSGNKFVTTTEKQKWNNKGTYSKPSGGIPKTDMTSEVQTSLNKADTALQQHQDISGKVDKTSFVYDSTTETLSITI